MDEAEWLASTDPSAMLRFVKGRVSERKLLLFTAACCRRLWRLLEDKRSKDAVTVGERYADKDATADEFAVARRRASEAGGALAYTVAVAVSDGWDTLTRTGKLVHPELQARLTRCIFGNPFRPVGIDPAWRTSTVVALAIAAYDNRILLARCLEADRLAILADALEDAGCDNADILSHLRGPGPHARGCFVLDWILKKE